MADSQLRIARQRARRVDVKTMLRRRAAAALRQRELEAAGAERTSAAVAARTRRAYEADWFDFIRFCHEQDLGVLPANPASIALYLGSQVEDGKAAATIARRLSAIAHAHRLAGHHPPPTDSLEVRRTMAGIRRSLRRPASPTRHRPEELGRLLAAAGTGAARARDRALLMMACAARLRPSQLVGLRLDDLVQTSAGLAVRLRDGASGGHHAEVLMSAADEFQRSVQDAVRAWITDSGIESGPLFRALTRSGRVAERQLSTRSVTLIVKRAAVRAGFDPALFSARSLRQVEPSPHGATGQGQPGA